MIARINVKADTMSAKKKIDWRKRFVGKWRCCDHFSDVRILVRRKGAGLRVAAIDEYDGEHADIYDVIWQEEQQVFSFAAHWSSGRFVKFKFSPSPAEGRLELTFTYTDMEVWERA